MQRKINTLPAGKQPEITVVGSDTVVQRPQKEIQGVSNVGRCHPRRVRTT